MQQPPLIVFSHLQWNSVQQRPHHLMRLFSKNHPVLWVEEPGSYTKRTFGAARIKKVEKNIWRFQAKVGWKDATLFAKLIKKYASSFADAPMIWTYSPSFIDVIKEFEYVLLTYDCMDELANFDGAPRRLQNQEHELLRLADLVTTGGKLLYESKSLLHDNVHCFPSSVDRNHFKKVHTKNIRIPNDIARIPSPIAGFYGVIDERLDYSLLAQVAKQLPQISFVMIGPFAKIDPKKLPKRKNIYYLGSKHYEHLPKYLKAFDVAFMPFALNKATKFISPTKTLEFMAAYKPIVSTPVHDVVRDYSHVVSIAQNATTFSESIVKLLSETARDKKQRIALQKKIVEKTSWKNTAEQMELLLKQVLIAKTNTATRSKKQFQQQPFVSFQNQLALALLPSRTKQSRAIDT